MLYGIMNAMKEDAGIQNRKITPYSARKRLIQTLQDNDVPPNQIVQISGHKNLNPLNSYSHINPDQCMRISNILAGSSSSSEVMPKQKTQTCTSSGVPQGMFSGTHFHGPVTFNFNASSASTSLSQMTVNQQDNTCENRYKRIRLFPESDSDSQ